MCFISTFPTLDPNQVKCGFMSPASNVRVASGVFKATHLDANLLNPHQWVFADVTAPPLPLHFPPALH